MPRAPIGDSAGSSADDSSTTATITIVSVVAVALIIIAIVVAILIVMKFRGGNTATRTAFDNPMYASNDDSQGFGEDSYASVDESATTGYMDVVPT